MDKYLVTTWTTENGLPGNSVNDLAELDYLWIATNVGLVRFDGNVFHHFTKMNTSSLSSDKISVLHVDNEKRLWIGTDGGGLICFHKGRWKKYAMQNGLSNNYIKAIESDWKGNIWIGTAYGLNCLKDEEIKKYFVDDGLAGNIITALEFDDYGNLWIGSLQRGITKYFDHAFVIFDDAMGLENLFVNTLTSDKKGNLLVGTIDGIFQKKYNQKYFTKIDETDYMPVTDFLEKDKKIWFGTMNAGIKYSKNQQIKHYYNFPEEHVNCLLEDSEGNVWIGTDAEGLVHIQERKINNITMENGLPGKSITAIIKDHENKLWFGVKNFGLCQYKNNSLVKTWDKNSDLTSIQITSLCQDFDGNIWIGTESDGVNILNGDSISSLTMTDGLTSNKITVILQDESGKLWIGTQQGLNCYREKFFDFEDSFGLKSQIIKSIVEKNDKIYVATSTNIYQKEGHKFMQLFPENLNIEISTQYIDGDENIWLGTNGNGLILFKEKKGFHFTIENGLPDNYIYSISEDRYGNLWMSSNTGIIKIEKRQILAAIDTKEPLIFATKIDESQGMISSQCIGNVHPACWQEPLQLMYFPTSRGIVSIDPDLFQQSSKPEVIIEKICINNEEIDATNLATFNGSIENIEIKFTTCTYSGDENLWFRYKMDNEEFIYLQPGEKRIATYSKLKPGLHVFSIQSKVNNSDWGIVNDTVRFSVESFNLKALMYIVIIVLLGVAIVVFLLFRSSAKPGKSKLVREEKESDIDPDIIANLEKLMVKEKIYLNPDLTMKLLAQKLHIHNNSLSKIINEYYNMNFNDFINSYRIEEAKVLLHKNRKKTISDIMYRCGFYSKSTFNTAFKKFTNMTPSQFRKEKSVD